MGQLDWRVDALERIAEEVRMHPYRAVADELGIPLEELVAEAEEDRRRLDALRAAGVGEREILSRYAAEVGVDAGVLERVATEIVKSCETGRTAGLGQRIESLVP